MPILLFDKGNNIIAAIHAGWKGAFKDIIKKVINFLLKNGSTQNNIIAAVGPCIKQNNYNVKKDFKKKFIKKDKRNRLFFKTKKNTIYFDLPGFVKYQLKSIAIGQLNPYPKCINFLYECDFIKAFVCVGLNQYDHLIDTNLSKKLFQINNPITDNFISSIKTNKDFYSRKDIVYMGALFPQKNFLYLAKNWHRINH